MATRFVKCSYQEVIDLHTESDKVTAIGIHTPTGDTPRRMFKGYFDQYKRYKYYGASIKFVPAARLPADIEGVSYAAGEPGVDPRDLMNPILVHGCHGNDMGTILNKLYGDNNELGDSMDLLENPDSNYIQQYDPFYDAMERLYYKALTDTTWKKANVQRGFRKNNLRPLVYSLAVNHQIMPGFGLSEDSELILQGGIPTSDLHGSGSSSNATITNPVSNDNIKFFTPRLMRLGWMDTRNVITDSSVIEGVNTSDIDDVAAAIHQGLINQVRYSELEKLFMLMILLPPAYKTEVHFRCIITHHFGFKDFRGISFMPEVTGVPSYHGYGWNSVSDKEEPVSFPPIEGVDPFPDPPSDPTGGGGDDPEPDPDPDPEPTVPVYTYDSVVGGTNERYYSGIRSEGVLCEVITSYQPILYNFTGLIHILNDFRTIDNVNISAGYYPYQSDHFLYYPTGKVIVYDEDEDKWAGLNTDSYVVTSSSPSDYYSNIVSGNYTLEAYE